MKPVSRLRPLKHYLWGEQCDGWNLVDTPELSVKMERMPPHTAEQLHFHQQARQFFFILKGTATFYFAGESRENLSAPEEGSATEPRPASPVTVQAQEGLEIPPGLPHRISNEGEEDLEFILSSQPSTAADRMVVK
ncbi:MAG: cupin domain-containing protein [Bacteroidota bacterium]